MSLDDAIAKGPVWTGRIPGVRLRAATWEMTPVELARVFAHAHGYRGAAGGWIYDPDGHPVAHGWQSFADALAARGWIVEGKGVAWTKATWEGNRLPLSKSYRAELAHDAKMQARGYELRRVLRGGRMITAWTPKER